MRNIILVRRYSLNRMMLEVVQSLNLWLELIDIRHTLLPIDFDLVIWQFLWLLRNFIGELWFLVDQADFGDRGWENVCLVYPEIIH